MMNKNTLPYRPADMELMSRQAGRLSRKLKSGDRILAHCSEGREMTELLREHNISYFITRSAHPGQLVFEVTDPDTRGLRITGQLNN